MRTLILALVAALASATGAMAQQSVDGPNQKPNIPQGSGEFSHTGSGVGTSADAMYMTRLAMIQRAAARQTHADGGRLTPAHQAKLQRELDALNGHYKVATASR